MKTTKRTRTGRTELPKAYWKQSDHSATVKDYPSSPENGKATAVTIGKVFLYACTELEGAGLRAEISPDATRLACL